MAALNVTWRYSKRKTSLIPVLEIPQARRSEQRLGFCLTRLVAGFRRRKWKNLSLEFSCLSVMRQEFPS